MLWLPRWTILSGGGEKGVKENLSDPPPNDTTSEAKKQTGICLIFVICPKQRKGKGL